MNKNQKNKVLYKMAMFIIMIVIIYLLFQFVFVQKQITEKTKELKKVQNDIEFQIMSNEELERYLDTKDEREYMERLAREKYDYAYPSEQIFYDKSVE